VEKSIFNSHEVKNQHAIGFMKNKQHETSYMNNISLMIVKTILLKRETQLVTSFKVKAACNKFHEKNQCTTKSMKKICFTRKKINVEVSRRVKRTCSEFSRTKISTQQVPRTK